MKSSKRGENSGKREAEVEQNVRIAILEDEQEAAELLESYIAQFYDGKDVPVVAKFESAVNFLEKFRNNYDILFLDIELPDGDGMEVARKVRKTDKNIVIIFVTNMAQFAIKGYEVQAFDYFVKPVTYKNFCIKFAEALDLFTARREVPIWISNKEGKRRLLASRIKYIESYQHMLVYHTLDGDYRATGSLAALEEQLAEGTFAMCNRCYLVNLRFVTLVRQFDCTVGGDVLQISHGKRGAFLRALTDYLAGGG